MKAQLLGHQGPQRSYALVFASGDEVMRELLSWSRAQRVRSASFTGIGAFRNLTVGYFDVDLRDYLRIVMDEQVEVLSLAGNAPAGNDDDLKVHAHVVVGKRGGTAHGGHLLEAHVRPTLELVVIETASHLGRRIDAATGLPLLHVKD